MSAPIETKVIAATSGAGVGTAISGFILWILDTYAFGDVPVPDAIVVLVWAVVPISVTFLSGFFAKHTPRPDLLAQGAPDV